MFSENKIIDNVSRGMSMAASRRNFIASSRSNRNAVILKVHQAIFTETCFTAIYSSRDKETKSIRAAPKKFLFNLPQSPLDRPFTVHESQRQSILNPSIIPSNFHRRDLNFQIAFSSELRKSLDRQTTYCCLAFRLNSAAKCCATFEYLSS